MRHIAILFVSASFALSCSSGKKSGSETAMTLHSSVLREGKLMSMAQVYNAMGCTGQNVSPDLSWSGAPEGTRAFAITVFDPDASGGAGWWHWIVYNIPFSVVSLAAGADSKGGTLPSGAVSGNTDFGTPGYGGPCPPPGSGPHRYIFTIYALSELLPLVPNESAETTDKRIRSVKLAEASLTPVFERK